MSTEVRQWDLISLMLYFLAVEPLAKYEIQNNNKINGILLSWSKINLKLMQCAEDTVMFVQDTNSIPEIFKVLHLFGEVSASNVNKAKTKAQPLGGLNYLEYEKTS
jgi:hypothetical protein